jgi:parallel beta-helix repeat protein
VSWVILDGLGVENARWLEAEDAHHNIVRHCRFESSLATGTTGNVRFIQSHDNRILDNLINAGNDNLLLIDSERNVVEGNTITEGGHSIFGIRCGDRNVIRKNFFANSLQKIGEVYDCGEDTSAVSSSFDSTKQNLIEENEFTLTDRYYSTSGGNGIQYAGQDGIIRRNVFRNANVGLGMQTYEDEALYNTNNRIYNNVFHQNECAGISLSEAAIDNVFVNNILSENLGWDEDCDGDSPAQLLYRGSLENVRFWNNNLWGGGEGLPVILEEFDSGDTLASFEAALPSAFYDNLELDPMYVDASAFDFHLSAESPLRDAGAYLTAAVGDGSGTDLVVEDARFFYDGFGIAGEVGDAIQLEGQTETAQVTGRDLETNRLTLDRALTWADGQGVGLARQGDASDIGAFEAL